jgi:hypothetical protein
LRPSFIFAILTVDLIIVVQAAGLGCKLNRNPVAFNDGHGPSDNPKDDAENRPGIRRLPLSSPRACNRNGPSAAPRIFLATC